MKIIKTPSFQLATYIKGDEKSSKLALVLPGRLDTKDYANMVGHVDFLAKHAFHALSFDPPGSWESSGTIEDYNATNYLRAINELIEYFGNKKTVLIGHSRGGSMAILAAARNTNVSHFVSIMSNVGPTGFDESKMKDGFYSTARVTPGDPLGRTRFKLPLSHFEDSRKYNYSAELKMCKQPKLFILGKKDDIVSPDEVRAGYDMATDPKELYELDSDHDYRNYPDKISEVNEVIYKFLGL